MDELKAFNHDRVVLGFYLGSSVVGVFKDDSPPTTEGSYRYEPYRGPGHYSLQTELKASRTPRCFYQTKERRVSFTVSACPSYGVLVLTDFDVR